jgi:ketosteroid isomerase-like protein
MHARLISFWRKDADGAWKLAAHVPALNPEAPRSVPAGFGTPNDNGLAGAGHRADAAASLAAVLQADRDFAALAAAENVQVAFAAFAAPTGVVMGGPEYGPDEIRASFAEAVAAGATLEWGPILGGVAESGDLGYTVGLAVSNGPNGKRYTKYLSIWQRQPDGRFKYVADGGTSRPAPTQ